MHWPRLGMPTPAVVTSGWSSPRTIGARRGIHGSFDFANKLNDPIAAVADGIVVKAARGSGETGNYVLIKHPFPDGLVLLSRYIHLNAVNVAAGQIVRRGQMIGYAGNSGVSGAIHLHLDVHVCGEAALQSYKRTFGWPTTTGTPLIKRTLPGCTLVPSEPLVEVGGYRAGVVSQAATYGLTLFPNRTDPVESTLHPAIKILIGLGLVGTIVGTSYYGWVSFKSQRGC